VCAAHDQRDMNEERTRPMKALLLAGVMALMSSRTFAQTPGSVPAAPVQPPAAAAVDARLATPTGHEVALTIGGYDYVEPGALRISLHGAKIGAAYAGALSLDARRHWFVRTDVRASGGNVAYDGWCYPFLITPNAASPNGYELDVGDVSPCSDSGGRDWYLEARGLVGKDFIAHRWGVSPDIGLGVRHLSSGLNGLPGYRTDEYLYVPVGLTARTEVASHRALSVNLEYDRLLRGWQKTRDSELGGGDVPATPTAPAFTINGFTDISFAQHSGWALRASARYQVTSHFSLEPTFIHWSVGSSPVNTETVTFTVNDVTVQQQLGAYEPLNTTNEFFVKVGFRFRAAAP